MKPFIYQRFINLIAYFNELITIYLKILVKFHNLSATVSYLHTYMHTFLKAQNLFFLCKTYAYKLDLLRVEC